MFFSKENLSEKIQSIDKNISISIQTIYLPQYSNETESIYAFGYFIANSKFKRRRCAAFGSQMGH